MRTMAPTTQDVAPIMHATMNGDDDGGEDCNVSQNGALSLGGGKLQLRVVLPREPDDLVDGVAMGAEGLGHLQIGVAGRLGVALLHGRQEGILDGLPEVVGRRVRRLDQLIAQGGGEFLLAPERLPLVVSARSVFRRLRPGSKVHGSLAMTVASRNASMM